MANRSIALSAFLAGSLWLPLACRGAGDSGSKAGAPTGSVATPLHGPCVDWPVAGEHPVPTALAAERDSPWAIAVDRANVYWTESSGVWSAPVNGGAAIPLARSRSATALTVDAENLYFADATGVWSVPLYGGPPTRLFAGPTAAQGLAVDGRHVYWTDSNAGAVMRVPRKGGTATVVATGEHAPMGIAVDSTQVVWTVDQPGSIETVLLSKGGLPTSLASSQNAPQQIALDAQNAYWTNGAGTSPGSVMEVPLGGGTPIALASGQTDPQGIAAASVPGAGTYVYWVNTAAGTLMATAAIGGFQPTVLASGLGRPERIALGADSIYWTDNSSGNVMQLACSRGVDAVDAGSASTMEAAAEDSSPEAAAEPTDSTIEDAPDEDDVTDLRCRDFVPENDLSCTTQRPICRSVKVMEVSADPPDASTVLTGGTIQPGTYVLSAFAIITNDPQCRYPLSDITSTVVFTPTNATSGTTQTATISYPLDRSAAPDSQASTGTYATSGSTITLTTTCPAPDSSESANFQDRAFVGSYAASSMTLIIAGDVSLTGVLGGACSLFTLRFYNLVPPDAGAPIDAAARIDAAAPVDGGVTVDDGGTTVTD